MKFLMKIGAWILLGIGIWLVFWNPVDYLTQGFDHGIWDLSIVTGGWLSILVGVIIIIFMCKYGRQVLI